MILRLLTFHSSTSMPTHFWVSFHPHLFLQPHLFPLPWGLRWKRKADTEAQPTWEN